MSSAPIEFPRRPLPAPVILVAAFLASWGLLHAFPVLRRIIFLTFFSLVMAVVLDYPIRLFARWMPRWAATLVTMAVIGAAGVGVITLAMPTFIEQAERLAARVPTALDRIQHIWNELTRRKLVPGDANGSVISWLRGEAGRIAARAIPIALGVASALGHVLLSVVLALFLAHRPTVYARGLLRLVPGKNEEGTAYVIAGMAEALQKWTLGVLLSMTAIGTLTGLGLALVGVDLWFALGVLAFFGEFVPYVGPIATAIPGIAVALVDSPAMAAKVALIYLTVQMLESNLIQPVIMRWAVRIQPALLLVWQILLAGAFGLGGLIVATPLLAALQAGIQYGYVERVLGKKDVSD